MKLESILNSQWIVEAGLWLAQRVPPGVGYRVSGWIANLIASQNFRQVNAVRANQWVVQGGSVTLDGLNQVVRQVYRSVLRSLYDFYHYLDQPDAVMRMVELDESMKKLLDRNRKPGKGLLMVVPHMTNFDLVGRAVALNGMKLQILSYPRPNSGYQRQNELRKLENINITPMSIDAFRQASEFLKAGGAVVTGVDRPLNDGKYRPRFFGRPAALPVGHVRLAIKVKLPVVVISACRMPDGHYRVWAGDPIEMQPSDDLQEEITGNAETILAEVERGIRVAPEQWAMFYPVWGNNLQELSG